eukprot:TRINITY_DN6241_c0_g2_i3.p1 TRINITY_DN6241_c0_g2~~TRINITY_DN6241_c0_g2_i3.p1  ORF type:complete len:585 (+),score=95.96 TRINITY_DN6241_c0_g2_i3:52-1806(+)
MEVPLEQKQEAPKSSKGGMRSMPFVIANETIEKVASFGLLANMVMYLTKEYHIGNASAGSILFMWSAISNFLPIVGAFISDSYLGRFRVIAWGSIASLLGIIVLWLTAMIPGAKPDPCDQSCKTPTASQLAILLFSFVLMSIGAGGIRPCSLAFGADQVDREDNPKNARVMQTFFNWYYSSVSVSIMVSITVIVYIQDKKGWKVGFGIPALLMLLSAISFILGSPFYKKVKPCKSLFTGFAQVMVASYKNRGLDFPPNNVDGWYHHSKGSKIVAPTDKMRFLNKACIIRNHEKDINPDGSASNPWNLCTVDQVEVFKSLVKVMPIWSAGIMNAVTINQHSFPVLQASTMDRHLSPKFEIPPGSFGVFALLALSIWVAIYDRMLVPLLARFTKRPRGLSVKQRMGAGVILASVATAVAALVERARRNTAIQQGVSENKYALVNMSAMWLVPQQCLTGVAEAFNAIGQIEFYYSEFPKSMASIGVALFSLSMAVGNLVGVLIVQIVDKFSRIGGKESWVADNLNKGHYDYYYWILSLLCAINFPYFLYCSWAYGYCNEELEAMALKKGEANEEEAAHKSTELPILL